MAVDPTGRFAYVVNVADSGQLGAVSALSIGPNGALAPVPGSPFPAGFGTISVTVDPAGEFVYVPNEFGNDVSAYSIGPDGALTPVPISKRGTGQISKRSAQDGLNLGVSREA